ncbi:MAG: alpha/beta hydrolase [Pseudomonadota bacterium]
MVAKIKLTVMWLLSVMLLLVPVSGSWSETLGFVPRFESTTCKHTLEPNSTTQCGYLTVLEDRGKPDGRTIQIYVGIFKNLKGPMGTEPLFYLMGGPGASTADAFNIFEDTSSGNYIRQDFGDNRDIVVIDQRGTNNSQPALYCSEELGPLRSQVYGISFREAAALRIQAFLPCYNRFKNQGIDLSAYNTLENATDIKELAAVLGYNKINLYSASYGTRLGMQMMKDYPEVIKSVVLDSILPPEINPFEKETPGVLYSFRSFFDAARSEYPLLETYFYRMMDELEASPVNVIGHHYSQSSSLTHHGGGDMANRFMSSHIRHLLFHRYDQSGDPIDNIVVNVSGDKLAFFLVGELKQTPYDAALPKKINAMYTTGDYGPVADAWISNIDFFFPNGGPGSESASVGMYNCIFSAQDAYYTSPYKIYQVIHENVSNTSIASWLETNFIFMEPGILGLWPVAPLPFHESNPLLSDIPTLMLVGSLDNATPAIFSRPSAVFLSQSTYLSILAGHATAYLECVAQMINRFVKNPSANPVNTCSTQYLWARRF